jgi:DNA-directed RNA polymerase subunit RPC12/RpoP
MNPIKDSYPGGVCPDCGEEIPDNVVSGEECPNCGHVFCLEQKVDDED